jgi:hypothetical protein
MDEIRDYITEKVFISTQIAQYLEAMKAVFFRIMEETRQGNLDQSDKRETFKRVIRDVISQKVDYTNKRNINTLFTLLFKDVKGIAVESLNIEEAPVKGIANVSKEVSGPVTSFLQKRIDGISNFLFKYSSVLDKVKFGKYVKIASISVAILTAVASAAAITARVIKNVKQDRRFKTILDRDINPRLIKLSDLIIEGKIRDTGRVEDYIDNIRDSVFNIHRITPAYDEPMPEY